MEHPIQPARGGSTSTGLAPHVAGGLAYVLTFVSGIVFLLVEKENEFVRFHAAQSVVVFGALGVANIALNVLAAIIGVLPVIGDPLALLLGVTAGLVLGLGGFVLWIVLMTKAFTGSAFEIPVAAGYARQLAAAVRV